MTQALDLRSDTVTLPPEAMRAAMASALVGDDVYGEDPTVNAFEARGAEILGKQAAVLVPSGVMGNLLAVLGHCQRGDEIIVGDRSHMYLNEGGGASVMGGTTAKSVPTAESGELAPEDLRLAVRAHNLHFPRTGLICIENTHNFTGGQVLSPAYMSEVRAVAAAAGVPVHLDGARLWNAAVALGVTPATLCARVDSVSVCFSKGLAAPVGSLLAGSAEFIGRARRWRKTLGGGMRQAGILAAAGLYALDHMVERLTDDHENAKALAQGLATMPGLVIAQRVVSTNIVLVDLGELAAQRGHGGLELIERLAAEGVKVSAVSPFIVRFVTHWGIDRKDIDLVLARVQRAWN